MSWNFVKNVAIDLVGAQVAAGSTDVVAPVSTGLDMLGFEGVAFLVKLGTITTGAEVYFHIEEDSSSSMGSAADIKNSASYFYSTEGSSGIVLVTEAFRPNKRYVRACVDRACANSVIDCVLAFRYRPGHAPVAESTTVNDFVLVTACATGSATG